MISTIVRSDSQVRELFAALNLMLLDAEGTPVAAGWGVPVRWDGHIDGLPDGYTDALVRAVEGHERGIEPDTLVICAAIVTPSRKGRGLAGQMLTALRDAGQDAGLQRVIAPRDRGRSRRPAAIA